VIIGTAPVALGLSLPQALAATLLGVLVGAVILAPMGLFAPGTGTNNAVSSGAHLGVRGRIVGSFLSLLTAIAFYSISVWVSGDALVGGMARLLGVADSPVLRAVVYAVLGSVVIVVVIYGYQFMLVVNKVVVIANTVVILLAIPAFAGMAGAVTSAAAGGYALGSFWPTFVLSSLIVMGNPISFGAFLGDWSRYIPASTRPVRLVAATLFAQLATLVPFAFGVVTATLTLGKGDYMFALVQIAPAWYATLLMIVAFLGGLSTGVTSLYGTGLDFSSVFPRLTRVAASLVIGVLAFAFILAGRLVLDLTASVNAFIGAIVICTTPWMVIMTIGYWTRRGVYFPADVQVFNRGQVGGRYWFRNGVNYRAMAAWVLSAVGGLLFANYPPLVVGPLHDIAGGIDISLPVSLALAAVSYLACLYLAPEPRYVFGPAGPRVIPARDDTAPAIRNDHAASPYRMAGRAQP
jgi:purine-cytosine permease-like protein